jgi:hypothetical protein
VAPIWLWAYRVPHLDQGAILMIVTGLAGFVIGAIVGGILGARPFKVGGDPIIGSCKASSF